MRQFRGWTDEKIRNPQEDVGRWPIAKQVAFREERIRRGYCQRNPWKFKTRPADCEEDERKIELDYIYATYAFTNALPRRNEIKRAKPSKNSEFPTVHAKKLPEFYNRPPKNYAELSADERDKWWAEGEQLRRKIAAQPEPTGYAIASPAAPPVAVVALRSAAQIIPRAICWRWPGWLAAGKVHILAGSPGAGKTTLALAMASTISRGGHWPDGAAASVGNVVVWSGEDDAADVIVPRLLAAGADPARVHIVGDIAEGEARRAFDPAKDMPALSQAIDNIGGCALLIVDPVVSAVAGDSHKNAEVRRALQPLVDLAEKRGAAILGITHLTKGTQGREPTERVTGSLAFGALARVVMVAAERRADGDEGEAPPRALMRAKSNIGPCVGGFEYTLAVELLEGFGDPIETTVARFGCAIEGSARDVLAEAEAVEDTGEKSAVRDAAEWLKGLLAAGAFSVRDIRAGAEANGHSWRSVERARKTLNVAVKREGNPGRRGGGNWAWALSGEEPL